MWWTIVLGAVIVYFVWEATRSDPSPEEDKPGKFFYTKRWLFYLMLLLNGRKQGKKRESLHTDRTRRGYGQTVLDPTLLECCQTLEPDPDAIDTTYFNGFDSDGTAVALRIARKHNRQGEVWLYLSLPGEGPGAGFFQHPLSPDSEVYNMAQGQFEAAGCRFQVLEPMRRWRVTYNGLLRKGLCNDLKNKPENYVYVKMSFYWECVNDPFNFDKDLDKWLLADGIAKQKWSREFFHMLRSKHQTHYEQCGQLTGSIEVEGESARRVHLRSFRDHTYGVRKWEMFHRYAAHFICVEETGVMVFVIVLWMPGYIKFLKSGYLVYANGETYPVTATDLDIVGITKDRMPPDNYSFSFNAAGQKFNVDVKVNVIPELYHYRTRTSRIMETLCTFSVNGLAGRGMVEFHYRNPEGPPVEGPEPKSALLLMEPPLEEGRDYSGEITLTFQEALCQSSALVGGKGSQLALLTAIQDQNNFIVPRGFCLTLSAFQKQLEMNPAIEKKIEEIRKAARNASPVMKSYCDDAVQLLASSTMIQPIEDAVRKAIDSTFGDTSAISLAVRSSAAGEDGSEASSAGQMETFLGVRGTSQVLDAVRKCWASAYTYQAVQYRRQHGQPVRTSVGVVVQEMVRSEVAGVLFTHDPLTGNPNRMVLDAAYGLGEIVVSGKATPDTIIVQRHFDDHLTIEEKRLGDKKLRINVSESGGTTETITDMASSQQCSLTDRQVLDLCQLAIEVENSFGGGRDIEWGIHGDQIYLLQARPITTDDQESDEELIHEFDSPIITGKEWLTIGNIGEMLPGCMTPLTASTFVRAVDKATAWTVGCMAGMNRLTFADNKCVVLNSARAFLNMTYLAQIVNNSIIGNKDALELNLLGETLADHKLENIVVHGRVKTNKLAKVWDLLTFFGKHKKGVKMADTWWKNHKEFSVGLHCLTAEELYKEIDSMMPKYYEIWDSTVAKSSSAGHNNGIMMGIISGGKNELTLDNYNDVSQLLSQCQDVYSAEVPAAIQDMARTIDSCGVAEKILALSDKECVAYLSSADCDPMLKEKYSAFLERHGHRCIRESEFTEKSWRAEPEKFIKILKSVLASKAYNLTMPEPPDIGEVIKNLRSPVSAIGKFILKKIVPKARKGVQQREMGKSVAVYVADKFKDAYWRLANAMVDEGRLPESELMFFLTHTEIGQLLATRSAKLISKAIRRRRVLPLQSKMEFPRFSVGRPQHTFEEQDDKRDIQTAFTLKGTPVCRGSVQGIARVVKCLEEASSIQKGDILIVSYTDIGWTPYFPLISGLITEMGGLVSHGAVVAREYGIPCLVNVSMATKLFNTGDSVHLDANAGAIHKLDADTTLRD